MKLITINKPKMIATSGHSADTIITNIKTFPNGYYGLRTNIYGLSLAKWDLDMDYLNNLPQHHLQLLWRNTL